MKGKIEAKKLFGSQLRRYRESTGLSQSEFAELMGTATPYISEAERGMISMGLDNLDKYAAFFGVEYYEFGNPKSMPPDFDALPAASRRAIEKLRKRQQQAKAKTVAEKAAQKEDGLPGRAKRLRGLIDSGFFKRPRTAKDAFAKLNPTIKKTDYHLHALEVNKITITLGQGRFIGLLDKLEPAPGTAAVRFVEKDPTVIKYLDGPSGTKDMAADGD